MTQGSDHPDHDTQNTQDALDPRLENGESPGEDQPGEDQAGEDQRGAAALCQEAARREAARLMGQARSQRKAMAVRENGRKGGRPKGGQTSEEARAKMREAQRLRRENERRERAVDGYRGGPRNQDP